MTVMGGVRVLQFGYPKVHDEKNVFYDLLYEDTSLGIDPETDAYIGGANWGQYYIAAIGVKLAEITDDLFVKTAIIRSVFALFGLLGILILALLTTNFFPSGSSKLGFLAVFLFMILISVPLALHLREARYYALTMFLFSVIIYIYAGYRILEKMRYGLYSVLLAGSLFLLFLVFSPAFFVFVVVIGVFESAAYIGRLVSGKGEKEAIVAGPSRGGLSRHFLNILPCLVSAVAVYPLFVFFDLANISAKLSTYYSMVFRTDPVGMYLRNLSFIWSFFASSGLIYFAIILKVLLLGCFLLRVSSIRNVNSHDMPEFTFSNFLSILFLVYFFAIAKIPNPLFTRYFINLWPVLIIILLMDGAAIMKITERHVSISRSDSAVFIHAGKILAAVFICSVIFYISVNIAFLKGHFFELTHRYQGPLDYVIPYIRGEYEDTDRLVIATNYEETSFMYYLGAKVTVGYAGNNLQADSKVSPDIIVFRKYWEDYLFIFNNFLDKDYYERITFPIYNSPVNNIPELDWDPPFEHQFKTQYTDDDDMKAGIYVRR